MANMSEHTFPSSDGAHQTFYTLWEPEGPARAVIQIVHGVAEYVGRYHDLACFLTDHGYVVAGDDHLGHGRTAADQSELGWFAEENGWKRLIEDEKRLHDILEEKYPGLPLVLLGHSMGSFMARTYLGWYPADYAACVLSGTGHQPVAVCRFGKLLAGREIRAHGSKYRSPVLQKIAFGGYLKRVKDPIGANDWICRDEAVIRAYDADPLCGYTATAGLMRDMMTGLDIIGGKRHMEKMRKTMPILFIAGSEDPVGAYGKGVEKVAGRFKAAGMEDVTVKLYPGMRHEVFNEFDKLTVWNDVLGWIEEKV